MRAVVSKRNKYWIPKHRYYELKHFCLQYPVWKEQLRESLWWSTDGKGSDPEWNDPTHFSVLVRESAQRKIDMVEKACKAADDRIDKWILKAVTEDLSFVNLSMVHNIPCGKDLYYDRLRKFFWLLDKTRDVQ